MQEKAVNRLGDRAAVGLIRYVGGQVPATSQEFERILGSYHDGLRGPPGD